MRFAPLAVVAAAVAGWGNGSRPPPRPPATSTSTPTATANATEATAAAPRAQDWTRFGYDAQRTNASPRGIAASEVPKLRERRGAPAGTGGFPPHPHPAVRRGGTQPPGRGLTTNDGPPPAGRA